MYQQLYATLNIKISSCIKQRTKSKHRTMEPQKDSLHNGQQTQNSLQHSPQNNSYNFIDNDREVLIQIETTHPYRYS